MHQRRGHTGLSPGKGYKDGEGLATSDTHRKAGTVQPGEEKLGGSCVNMCKYLMGGLKKMEPGSSQQGPMAA